MKKTYLVALAGAAMPLAPMTAFAQERPAASANDVATDDATGGEIIVTAQKRKERLIDVPIPLSVVSASELENSGVTNVSDITRLVTGMVFAKNGAWAQPTIRGVGTRSSAAGDSSNVAIYVDGVYLAAQQAGFTDFNNIERIEVLKGPQGTLFGRNATGGAISIVTRKPTHDWLADGSISYSSYNRFVGKFYATGGLTDTLAMDVALSFDRDSGYTRDLLTGAHLRSTDNYGVRSKLLWEPGNSVSVTLAGDYGRYRNNQSYAYEAVNGNITVARTAPTTAFYGVRPGEVALSFVPYTSIKQGGVSLTVEADLGSMSLKSISAYRNTRQVAFLDSDSSSLSNTALFIDAPDKTFTQELVATSSGAGRLNWVTGLFVLWDVAQRTPTRTIVGSTQNETRVNSKVLAIAPYGEATWNLTENFSVIGGLRYSYEKRKLENFLNGAPRVNAQKSYEHVDYRAVARYEFNSQLNAYLSHSTGFKSGVFNTSAFDGVPIRPETIGAWEFGMKSSLGGLMLSGDVFRYKYKDIQIQRSTNPLTGQTALQNAASGTIKGAELEVRGRIAPGLSVNAGVTYLDATYDSFPAADVLVPIPGGGNRSAAVDASGNPIIRTPKLSYNLGFDYRTPLLAGELGLSGSLYHSTSFAWEPSNRVRQPAYTLVSGQVSWTAPGGRYSIALFGDNLTNAQYYENVNTSSNGDTGVFAAPRRVGIRFGFRYD